VTVNGVSAPGSGQVLEFTALTSLAGTPLSRSSSTPANLPVTGGAVRSAPWIALGAGIVLVAAGFERGAVSSGLGGANADNPCGRDRRDPFTGYIVEVVHHLTYKDQQEEYPFDEAQNRLYAITY
jgi:hypothetical protein